MNKIEASSQLNVRNTWRVDSHVTDELGYGRYSTQIGIVQYESIHSHALISVCEDKILIVLTAHPDHPLQHRIDHCEESYCILFSDITDVVAKAASSVDAEDSSVMKTKMPRLKVFGKNRHSLHIYLKQHRGMYTFLLLVGWMILIASDVRMWKQPAVSSTPSTETSSSR